MTLVQPICIDKAATHHQAIADAASASVLAYLADPTNPAWEEWLDGAHTKTVRRARARDLDPLGLTAAGVARAGVPMTYEDMPRSVTRLQVSGTDLPRTEPDVVASPVTIAVLDTLTTGKAAAQAGHALWAWMLPLLTDDPEKVADFAARGAPVNIVTVTDADLPLIAGHQVRDNGLTEIPAGTLTAVAY